MTKSEVVVVVRNGMVESVLSDAENIVANILDLDTTDPDELDSLEAELDALKANPKYHEI